jgi:hypothetical protein
MTKKPLALRLSMKYFNGKNHVISGLKTDLDNVGIVSTAYAVNDLQEDSARFISKIEEAELTD